MNKLTQRSLDIIINFSTIREFKSDFIINPKTKTLDGFNIRFDKPIDINELPSIKEAVRVLWGIEL